MADGRGRGLEGYYAGLLKEQERSGQTFAEERGVSAWTLYKWRGKLNRSRRRARRDGDGGGLLAIDVVGSSGSSVAWPNGFEIVLQDGRVVRVPSDFDADRLGELLSVLSSC